MLCHDILLNLVQGSEVKWDSQASKGTINVVALALEGFQKNGVKKGIKNNITNFTLPET